MKKILKFSCTALAGVLLLTGCGKVEPPAEEEVIRPVRAIKIDDPTQLKGRTFSGRAKATQEVDLSFRVAGPLITFPVNVGDLVKKDDVVARIDPRDFEVNLNNVKGQLGQAQAELRRAAKDLQRLEKIYSVDPGATSEAAIDRTRQQRDSARANVSSIKASVAAAADQLRYASLKAPFDGIVVQTYVENFEDVRARQAVVRIVDDSRIELVINIPESLIYLVPSVKDIQVEFDAFPGRPIAAEIKEIGTEASQTTRTYPLTLIMDQAADFKILPGMAGTATGKSTGAREGTPLEVPVSAEFSPEKTDKSFVWVIDDSSKTVSLREVVSGDLTDRGIQISSGLKQGEWIVTAGVHYLRADQKVKLLAEQAK